MKKFLSISFICITGFTFTFIVSLIIYFSILGPKNNYVIDKFIQNIGNKYFGSLKIKNLKSFIYLNLKDLGIDVEFRELELALQKELIKIPSFKLNFSIIDIAFSDKSKILKSISFNGVKNTEYSDLLAAKIPSSMLIKFIKKYGKYISNVGYQLNDFSLVWQNKYKVERKISIKNLHTDVLSDSKGRLYVNISSLFSIDDFDLKAVISLNNIGNKTLKASVGIENLNSSQEFHIKELDLCIQSSFKFYVESEFDYLPIFKNIKFRYNQTSDGYLVDGSYLSSKLNIKSMVFDGVYLQEIDRIDINNFKFSTGNINIDGSVIYSSDDDFYINTNMNNFELVNLLKLWNKNKYSKIRNWVDEYISDLSVKSVEFIKKTDEKLLVQIKGDSIIIKNLDKLPDIYSKNVLLSLRDKVFTVDANRVSISNNNANRFFIKVDDIDNISPIMQFEGQFEGPLSSQLDVVERYVSVKRIFNSVSGNAITSLNFSVPLKSESINFSDLKFNVDSDVDQLNLKYGKYFLSEGNGKINLKNEVLKIDAHGKLNTSSSTTATFKIKLGEIDSWELGMEIKDNFKNFKNFGILELDKYFTSNTALNFHINSHGGNFMLDLTNSHFNFGLLSKKSNIKSYISGDFQYSSDDKVKVNNVVFFTPEKSLYGYGVFDLSNKHLLKLSGDIKQKHHGKLKFTYDLDKMTDIFMLKGEVLDLTKISLYKFLKSFKINADQSKNNLSVHSKLNTIKLKNNILLKNFDFDVSVLDSKENKVTLSAEFDNTKFLKFFYSYPVISLVSGNAGDFLSGFGIFDNVHSGNLEIKGKFAKDDVFKGEIYMSDFFVKKTPILLNLLMLSAPISMLESATSEHGMKFGDLICPIQYDKKYLFFMDCSTSSNLLALKVSGRLNINTGYLELSGIMIPQNIINSISNKIPILKIFTGTKGDGLLFSTTFTGKGYINESIKFQANYLSTLAPGFLKELFKKPILPVTNNK